MFDKNYMFTQTIFGQSQIYPLQFIKIRGSNTAWTFLNITMNLKRRDYFLPQHDFFKRLWDLLYKVLFSFSCLDNLLDWETIRACLCYPWKPLDEKGYNVIGSYHHNKQQQLGLTIWHWQIVISLSLYIYNFFFSSISL